MAFTLRLQVQDPSLCNLSASWAQTGLPGFVYVPGDPVLDFSQKAKNYTIPAKTVRTAMIHGLRTLVDGGLMSQTMRLSRIMNGGSTLRLLAACHGAGRWLISPRHV